jgi:hypothetical protein
MNKEAITSIAFMGIMLSILITFMIMHAMAVSKFEKQSTITCNVEACELVIEK